MKNDKCVDEIAVSVVCLTYNHEKYVGQMLESLVSQITDFRYEIIVHDDASTDGTKEIIEKYAEKYPDLVIPIYEEENLYSKSEGILVRAACMDAKGKYHAFCEGDDFWCDPHKLAEQYAVMEANPDCSICVHRVDCIYEDGSPHPVSKPDDYYHIGEGIVPLADIAEALWKKGGYPFQTSSYFVRRDVMEERLDLISQDNWTAYANGDVQTLKISICKGNCYYIEKVMSRWRQGNVGSYSSKKLEWTEQQRREEWMRGLVGDKLFDEYSGWRFHDYIVAARIGQILGKSKTDGIETKKMLEKFHVSFTEIVKYASWTEKLFYICIKINPRLLSKLVHVKRKITG